MTNKKALRPGDLRAVSVVAFCVNPSAADQWRIMLIVPGITAIRQGTAMVLRWAILLTRTSETNSGIVRLKTRWVKRGIESF